jgi:hypothetical protein
MVRGAHPTCLIPAGVLMPIYFIMQPVVIFFKINGSFVKHLPPQSGLK